MNIPLAIRCKLRAGLDRSGLQAQAGMTTAEYAVGTLAACSQHTSPS